jgi:RNA polymerase sigma-70 factor (ECF subfamily)
LPDRPKEGTLHITAVSEQAPGDVSGLEQTFLEHQGRVLRAAYRITGNAQDAEDVLQTVFLRLSRREGGSLPPRNLASYLYRAGVNTALDLLRSRRDPDRVALEDAGARLPDAPSGRPDRLHEAGEIRAFLREALARLSPRAAEVFALRHLEGYDNHEIAGMLGISRIAVAVTLHRTRHQLQKELRAKTRTRGQK